MADVKPFAAAPCRDDAANGLTGSSTSLNIIRVVEKRGQVDAAMPELRVSLRVRIRRAQVRWSIVGRKQDQEVEKGDQPLLIGQRKQREPVSRRLSFPAVTPYHILKRRAAPVMPVRGCRSHSPERRREELPLKRAVIVDLMEVRTKVVTLEIGEYIPHDERAEPGPLQRRVSGAVVDGGK